MAEYNNQRYYWIKLTDRFMTSDTVDFLMEQPNGAKYVVLYQMLCLKAVNNKGELSRRIGKIIIPFDENKIQRDSKWFDIDTIRVAMQLYKRLGLIYEQENGVLKIADFDRLVGSQSISAQKKQIQLANRGGQLGGKKVEKIPPDIDKDIKILDKEIDKDKEYNIPPGACARIDENFNEEFLSFCSKWGIGIDINSSLIADLDFEKLDKAYSESKTLLQDKEKAPYAHTLSWIVKNASSICAGKYKDRITNSNAQSNGGIIDGWSELYFKYKNEETS